MTPKRRTRLKRLWSLFKRELDVALDETDDDLGQELRGLVLKLARRNGGGPAERLTKAKPTNRQATANVNGTAIRETVAGLLSHAPGKKLASTILLARVKKTRPRCTGRMMGTSLRLDPKGRFRRSGLGPTSTWALK